MNFRGPILLILFIISIFIFRNQLSLEQKTAQQKEYRVCELRASTNTHTNSKSRLLINENTPAQVLHTRIACAVHFIKSNSIITGTILGVHQYLKHTFYTSDDPFIPSAELLLFPHHAFW
jgi:hypothetical protein